MTRRRTSWYVRDGGSLLVSGVVQVTRMERWLQALADGALWVLFRFSRVRF